MRRIGFMIGCAVVLPACEQVTRVDDDGGGACVPAEVQAAFDRSCGTAACHTAGGMQGSLSLDAGQSALTIGKTAVGSPLPLVELGNPAGSYLAQKIVSDPVVAITGARMPTPFDPNNANQVADVNTILTWIAGGEFECAAAGTGTDTDASESGSTGEPPALRACGLEDLAPGTQSGIVSGTAAMQIPPDIAPILEENCGCHYTNEYPTPPPYIDYAEGTLPLDMRTWAGFQAISGSGMAYHAVTLARVNGGPPIAMPPPDPYCEAMPADDTATLVQWLTEGAPDCTTWSGCDGGGGTLQACGIEDIKPGSPNPIMSGDAAGQIPTAIGTILAGNCGCHYVDDPTADVTDYQGSADLTTVASFQAPYGGSGNPLHTLALGHVESEFMPLQSSCDIGGGEAMPAADRTLLVQWLTEGAPDGATFMP